MSVILKVNVDGVSTILTTTSPILSPLSSLPPGGTTGQALIKQSTADGDVIWGTVASGGGGGGSVNTVNNVGPVSGNVTLSKTDIGLGSVPNTDATNASNIASGTLAFARIPTGTTSSTVAIGNHTHAISDVVNLTTTLAPLAALPASYAVGDTLFASATGTLSKLAAVATGNSLISGGTGTAPSWGKIGLATHVSGTLPAANGGTGQTTYAVGDVLFASGATALSKLAGVATGNALISGGVTTAPSWGKIVLGTHTSGTLPTTSITDPANSNQGLDVTLTGFSPVGHVHDFSDITTGDLSLGQFAPGMVIYIDKSLADYGAAGLWPSARPTSSTSVKVVWMGDTDPGSIALDRDIWYQTL